ncbi:hypothetical protein BJ912DRAFT_167176 [Pholiota molesta]|nr:hypothetical protein BJ912DRAFT_167176 [Pholiota molesta]
MYSTSPFFLAVPILLAHACPISSRPADSPFPIRLTSLLASQQGCASASICSARDFRWIYGAFFPARSARNGRFPSPLVTGHHAPSRTLRHPRLARPRCPGIRCSPRHMVALLPFPYVRARLPSRLRAPTTRLLRAACMPDLLRLYGSFLRRILL